MRYSILNYICCSHCNGDLAFMPLPVADGGFGREETAVLLKAVSRVAGEAPAGELSVGLVTDKLEHTVKGLEFDRDAEIKEGLLLCGGCAHWYPLRSYIPELLPDHLRDWRGDIAYLKTLEDQVPAGIYALLTNKSAEFAGKGAEIEDSGDHYKKSEISIKEKVTDPHFFGPGYVAPFNPGNTDYTMHLIKRYGNVLPLLELKQGDVVLDICAGYAWTTEWLKKMGTEPIGVDICRTYLDISVERMKNQTRPHLVVGDIENLPLKNEILGSVLCYDAFHHIPDRKRAIGQFFRALKNMGNIVLAEPGGTHEFAKVSKEVMDKYGILEKGIELDELNEYCDGLEVLPPEQHYILKTNRNENGQPLTPEFIHAHAYVDCNVYLVKKNVGASGFAAPVAGIKQKLKRKVKNILKRLFYALFH